MGFSDIDTQPYLPTGNWAAGQGLLVRVMGNTSEISLLDHSGTWLEGAHGGE
jgi:hypothetical protein